jgi:hypothetical protein
VIETTDAISAIVTTIELDHLRGAKFARALAQTVQNSSRSPATTSANTARNTAPISHPFVVCGNDRNGKHQNLVFKKERRRAKCSSQKTPRRLPRLGAARWEVTTLSTCSGESSLLRTGERGTLCLPLDPRVHRAGGYQPQGSSPVPVRHLSALWPRCAAHFEPYLGGPPALVLVKWTVRDS